MNELDFQSIHPGTFSILLFHRRRMAESVGIRAISIYFPSLYVSQIALGKHFIPPHAVIRLLITLSRTNGPLSRQIYERSGSREDVLLWRQ